MAKLCTSVPFGGLEILRSAFDKVTEQMAQLPEGKLVVGKGQLDSFLGPGTDDRVVWCSKARFIQSRLP